MICNFSVFNILYMYGEDNTPPLSDHSIGLEQHTIGSLKNWKTRMTTSTEAQLKTLKSHLNLKIKTPKPAFFTPLTSRNGILIQF